MMRWALRTAAPKIRSFVVPGARCLSSDSQRFTGKNVVVTGGAEGIGRGTALAFAQQGAAVLVADIKGPTAEERSKEAGISGSIEYVECDAGDAAAVEAACTLASERFGGRVSALVNNVAVQPEAPCHEMSLEEWNRAIAVNLTSVFLFSKFTLPMMLEHGGGSIVNVASVQGLQSQPGIPGYAASKGGVLSLTRQLAMEYGNAGVRVNSISPGTINTPLVAGILKLRGTTKEEAGAVYPMKRIGEIPEIANAILFLASDDASFVTAENLTVDGGIMGLGGWAAVA